MGNSDETSHPIRIACIAQANSEAAQEVARAFGDLLDCERIEISGPRPHLGWPTFSGLLLESAEQSGPGGADETDDPALPVAVCSELADPESREQFLDCVVGYSEVRRLFRDGWRIADLIAFNVRERFRVIGHDPKKHKGIGRLVAKAKDHPREFLEAEITSLFLSALARPMTRRKHVHVLEHVAEFVARNLDPRSLEELTEAIAAYGRGEVHRRTPLILLRRHVEEVGVAGLRAQSYLYPNETLLRFLELA